MLVLIFREHLQRYDFFFKIQSKIKVFFVPLQKFIPSKARELNQNIRNEIYTVHTKPHRPWCKNG